MEELIEAAVVRAVQPLLDQIVALRAEVEGMREGQLRTKLLSAKQAGDLVGRHSGTIARWCRGVDVDGVTVTLKSYRQPSGRYLIDEADLVAFSRQIAENYPAPESAAPATPSWTTTRQTKRRFNKKGPDETELELFV